jgi:cell division septum initiation protein DivIVA
MSKIFEVSIPVGIIVPLQQENESLRQQVKELSEQVYQLRKELDATVKAAAMMLGVNK